MSRDMTKAKNQLMIQSIKRWHILPMIGEQTVADHTCGVMILVRAVWVILARFSENYPDITNLLILALEHDMEEVGSGDTPPKDTDLKDFEKRWDQLLWIERIVKFCDILEAYFTLQRLCPTPHGQHVKGGLWDKIGFMIERLGETPEWTKASIKIGTRVHDEIIGDPWDYSVS